MGEWEHSEMLFLTLPRVGPIGSSYDVSLLGGWPPRGVILNVSRRSVRAHGFGTLPHQAEIWFITWCPQICGTLGRLCGEDVIFHVSSYMELCFFREKHAIYTNIT